jgi:adenosylmethionine-8-amino-7-oxononanoate aminotransferase
MPKFEQTTRNVGDWVKWKSQAQGTWIEKTGQVVAIMPPNVPY